MSRSNDAGHFFQTSEALATTERKAAKAKNKHGDPIRLPSKILAVHIDPLNDAAIYVAEAAGDVKRIVLDSREIKRLPCPANAPLTSLAISSDNRTLYAGCWDQQIYAIPVPDGAKTQRSSSPTPHKLAHGHTDFLKCLLATPTTLISGGADSTITLWDLTTIPSPKPAHKLKTPSAVQALALDPTDPNILFTAHSDPTIHRWDLTTYTEIDPPIPAHDTSIYALSFDTSGDLWTCSADKTARHLVRDRDWECDTTLPHPDFVRDLVVSEVMGVIVTACRDENVRVWDLGTGELVCVYEGHYEEVTGLVLVDGGRRVVSVGIDGTVRCWGLGKGDMEAWKMRGGEAVEEVKKEGVLTEEEEAELRELMDSDDD